MLPYKNLIIIDKRKDIPLYRQIAVQFITLIREGKLHPGSALPSTRILAFDLHIHRKTVMAAYDTLVSEDWIDNMPRKGYVVSTDLPLVRPKSHGIQKAGGYANKNVFSFEKLDSILNPAIKLTNRKLVIDDGFPDISLLPTSVISRQFGKSLEYYTYKAGLRKGPTESSHLVSSLSSFIKETRGITMDKENLFVTRGAQMAIFIAASLIIKPKDKIIVSDPSYFIADALFKTLGAELIRVPVDSQGICTESVEEALTKNQIKMIYIIPHHHHPTTVTMSIQRREHMLKLIKSYDVAVIEDDYDYDFQFKYSPYLPLASEDHGGKVIYVGSLTKLLGAPFRLGYLIATEDFLEAARKLRRLIDIRGDAIIEEAVAGLIDNGDLNKHIQKSNKIYAGRCDFLSGLIHAEFKDKINFTKPAGGLALWLQFSQEYDLSKIIRSADKLGLSFSGSVYCGGDGTRFNALRFGYASLEEEQLTQAIEILKKSVDNIYK